MQVSGSADSGYAIYTDIAFADGSKMWGYTISFDTGGWSLPLAELMLTPTLTLTLALTQGRSVVVKLGWAEQPCVSSGVLRQSCAHTTSLKKSADSVPCLARVVCIQTVSGAALRQLLGVWTRPAALYTPRASWVRVAPRTCSVACERIVKRTGAT